MGVAPMKIISVVILPFEVALVTLASSPNIITVTKKLNKQVLGKFCNFKINWDHSNKK